MNLNLSMIALDDALARSTTWIYFSERLASDLFHELFVGPIRPERDLREVAAATATTSLAYSGSVVRFAADAVPDQTAIFNFRMLARKFERSADPSNRVACERASRRLITKNSAPVRTRMVTHEPETAEALVDALFLRLRESGRRVRRVHLPFFSCAFFKSNPRFKHAPQAYASPNVPYPSNGRRMTRPQPSQCVGLNAGGCSSFSKLYSFVPCQTYISKSFVNASRHCAHVFQSPGCSSVWWNPQSVNRRWFRAQQLRAYEKST